MLQAVLGIGSCMLAHKHQRISAYIHFKGRVFLGYLGDNGHILLGDCIKSPAADVVDTFIIALDDISIGKIRSHSFYGLLRFFCFCRRGGFCDSRGGLGGLRYTRFGVCSILIGNYLNAVAVFGTLCSFVRTVKVNACIDVVQLVIGLYLYSFVFLLALYLNRLCIFLTECCKARSQSHARRSGSQRSHNNGTLCALCGYLNGAFLGRRCIYLLLSCLSEHCLNVIRHKLFGDLDIVESLFKLAVKAHTSDLLSLKDNF